jgi:hypothetical protein
VDPSYIEENAERLRRMRALVGRLDDDALRAPVNEHWSVAGILGHIAFWDARVIALADKLERGESFTPSDEEPEDPGWINDAARPLIHAVPPDELAALALQLAEETDRRVASIPLDRMWPRDAGSPLNPWRAGHRGEHLDEIEAVLERRVPRT